MGKKLYTKENISKAETERLGIPELVVLKTNSDDVGLEVVHRRYFEDEKLLCPACRSSRTRCSKIVDLQSVEDMDLGAGYMDFIRQRGDKIGIKLVFTALHGHIGAGIAEHFRKALT